MLGDLSVHTIRWFTHSARESVETQLLCDTLNQLGLRQLVKEPTRGKYILDLILTDVPDCTAKPGAAVADHKGVLTQVRFKIKEIASHNNEVWHFSEADWPGSICWNATSVSAFKRHAFRCESTISKGTPDSRSFFGWHVLDRI